MKARADGQEAYIRYNKLIVNGHVYSNGKYDQLLGTTIVAGDLNSRVGLKPDYIDYDTNIPFLNDDSYVPDVPLKRVSMDSVSNSHGLQLLDLCKSTGIRICNGILEPSGTYTFCCEHGSSVIDYLLCKQEDFFHINDFTVADFNEFSDHTPLSFTLSCERLREQTDLPIDERTYIRWDSARRDEIRRLIISKLPEFNHVLNNSESINTCADDFVSLMNDAASPLFAKTIKYRDKVAFKPKVSPVKMSEWFDKECYEKKTEYIDALRAFNIVKTSVNRQLLHSKKCEYKTFIKKKKMMYKKRKMIEIENLRTKKPQEFWKYFSKKNSKKGENIDIGDFFKHFKALSEEINISNNENADEFCGRNLDPNDVIYEQFDVRISPEEIEKAIKSLKKGKAGSIDNLINEYFIEAGDILLGHITDLFNKIFESGEFPNKWMEGLIVSLYKKGDEREPSNYRGITLISCIAKLFT
ncbi:uncharacterized protein LOC128558889 [Mercenaria mercenaria]|uniref:uncharacterized protein LOC128558889 n=1 Tax=Mercenaria mercenaria TaxID=6596 RepID=UPI00234E762D|nr:uncharacterized protein LOC128558889 [Mercenaria mercenaria]